MDNAETDEMLVNRYVNQQDHAAFAELVRRHQDRIHRLAISLLGPSLQAEAEDIVQEVFLRAHSALKKFRSDAQFGSWVYRIAYNYTLNVKQKRRITKRKALSPTDAPVSNHNDAPSAIFTNNQNREILENSIEELPAEYQSVIRQYYWLGNSVAELAITLRVPENTIKSYLHRARRMLERSLSRKGIGNE